MYRFRESQGGVTLEYDIEPSVVAEAVQAALNACGKVASVQRETGVITGSVGMGWFHNGADVSIQIKKTGSGTQVVISGTAGEAALGGGSAQKCIAKLTEQLTKQPALKGHSRTGW